MEPTVHYEKRAQYLPDADAKAQMEAYTGRQDLIQQRGLQYSFDNLLKQYDLFIENYDPWSYEELSEEFGVGNALLSLLRYN